MDERVSQKALFAKKNRWSLKIIYLLCFSLCLMASPFKNAATPFQFSSILHAKAQNLSSKHCVSPIDVKFRETYMINEWLDQAKQKALSKWQNTAKKRFGSVYSDWQIAKNQKAKCLRVGFGNDQKGNVGTSVVCQYSGEPCALLVKSEAIKSKKPTKTEQF